MIKFILTFLTVSTLIALFFSLNTYTNSNSFDLNDSLNANIDSLNRLYALSDGKRLYGEKCKKCHTLYKPKDFSKKVWEENLNEMREKANLSDSDYFYISTYLFENSKK